MENRGKQNIAFALALTALMVIPSQTTKAEYVNAYVDGTVWECEGGDLGSPSSTSYYFTEGTTEIDNKEYLNFYAKYSSDSEKTLEGYLRYDNGLVYYCNPTQDEKGVIFDFNLKEGDSATIGRVSGNYGHVEVEEVVCIDDYISSAYGDNLEYMEIQQKKYISSPNRYSNIWIRGIGSKCGPIDSIYNDILGGSMVIRKVTVNGKVIYDDGLGITLPDEEKQIRIGDKVNLDGSRHIDGQKGIYIDRSGRKVID